MPHIHSDNSRPTIRRSWGPARIAFFTAILIVLTGGSAILSGCGGDKPKIVMPEKPAPLPDPSKRLMHRGEGDTTPPANQVKQVVK